MDNLITAQEFATFRDISTKLDEDKINECISLAQNSDLVEILGDFYFDLMKNKEVAEWQDLINGSEFEYNSEDYEHFGIKALLADYTYARFIWMINVNLTPFGAGIKLNQDSEAIDDSTKKNLTKQAQKDASNKFIYIEKYLLSDPTTFSRYCKNKDLKTGFNQTRISKL